MDLLREANRWAELKKKLSSSPYLKWYLIDLFLLWTLQSIFVIEFDCIGDLVNKFNFQMRNISLLSLQYSYRNYSCAKTSKPDRFKSVNCSMCPDTWWSYIKIWTVQKLDIKAQCYCTYYLHFLYLDLKQQVSKISNWNVHEPSQAVPHLPLYY